VKRSKNFKNPFSLFSSLYKFWRILVGVEQGPHDPHLSTLPNRLQRHMPYLREIWILYPKKKISQNLKNPKKFWKSEKNWNCRCQNFENIDLIILPNRSNRSKKSLNRLDRFIGQRINTKDAPSELEQQILLKRPAWSCRNEKSNHIEY